MNKAPEQFGCESLLDAVVSISHTNLDLHVGYNTTVGPNKMLLDRLHKLCQLFHKSSVSGLKAPNVSKASFVNCCFIDLNICCFLPVHTFRSFAVTSRKSIWLKVSMKPHLDEGY